MKKTCILLIFTLLSSIMVSCSGGGEPVKSTDIQSTSQAQTVTEGQSAATDELPEKDFDGESFDILISVEDFWGDSIHIPEEMTGEVLNDARLQIIYEISERFNVEINEITESFDFVNNSSKKMILAGDSTYDVLFLRDSYADSFVQTGLLLNYKDIPYIDLSKVYWDQGMIEQSTINNQTYFSFGSFDTTYLDRTHCLVFNKEMISDYSLESPYALVENGKWTLEAMTELMKSVSADINGDNKLDTNDRWGYLSTGKQVLVNFWTAAGEKTVVKDKDDMLSFGLNGNERFSNVIDRVFTVLRDENNWCEDNTKFDISETAIQMFTQGLGLFMDENLIGIKKLRSVELDFGILPYPKFDDTQDAYYSRVEAAYKSACVPITNENIEMTGILLEALNCAAYNTVIPAYYDISLKTKSARDSESEEMLDIILDSLCFDYGDTWWCDDIRDGIFAKMFQSNDRNLTSKIEKIEQVVNKHIEQTVKAYMN